MKKLFSLGFSIAAFSLAAVSAYASPDAPMSCALTFEAKGGGFQIGVGYFKLQGEGTVRCIGPHGAKEELPVRVTLGGHPLAPRVAIGYFELAGLSTSFGLNGNIHDVLGHYAMANADAAVGVGVGASFALQNPVNGLNMSLSVSGSIGIGVDVGLSTFTIETL